MLVCRTAVLGGHCKAALMGMSERYGITRVAIGCARDVRGADRTWLVQQKARLLACEHYHVISTLPDEAQGLWLANVRAMTNLLFATVHETLRTPRRRRSIWGLSWHHRALPYLSQTLGYIRICTVW